MHGHTNVKLYELGLGISRIFTVNSSNGKQFRVTASSTYPSTCSASHSSILSCNYLQATKLFRSQELLVRSTP